MSYLGWKRWVNDSLWVFKKASQRSLDRLSINGNEQQFKQIWTKYKDIEQEFEEDGKAYKASDKSLGRNLKSFNYVQWNDVCRAYLTQVRRTNFLGF